MIYQSASAANLQKSAIYHYILKRIEKYLKVLNGALV